jgi:trans-aconitate 2-methyltransferase
LLHDLGFLEQRVELRIYGHVLADAGEIVEWVKGSLLTDYSKRLTPSLYADFVERYRERLARAIGEKRPYFYTYKRILIWGRL